MTESVVFHRPAGLTLPQLIGAGAAHSVWNYNPRPHGWHMDAAGVEHYGPLPDDAKLKSEHPCVIGGRAGGAIAAADNQARREFVAGKQARRSKQSYT